MSFSFISHIILELCLFKIPDIILHVFILLWESKHQLLNSTLKLRLQGAASRGRCGLRKISRFEFLFISDGNLRKSKNLKLVDFTL